MRFVLALAVIVSAPGTAALAQSATDAALTGRVAAVGGLLSGIATLARQTGLGEEQGSTGIRKTMEAVTSASESQSLALAKAGVAREYATTSRTCPEVSAGRAFHRGEADAGMAANGLSASDAGQVLAGVDPLRRDVDADGTQGGEKAALLSIGMPLPAVPARSNAVSDEAARIASLRRAARVMTARYAIVSATEAQ